MDRADNSKRDGMQGAGEVQSTSVKNEAKLNTGTFEEPRIVREGVDVVRMNVCNKGGCQGK